MPTSKASMASRGERADKRFLSKDKYPISPRIHKIEKRPLDKKTAQLGVGRGETSFHFLLKFKVSKDANSKIDKRQERMPTLNWRTSDKIDKATKPMNRSMVHPKRRVWAKEGNSKNFTFLPPSYSLKSKPFPRLPLLDGLGLSTPK